MFENSKKLEIFWKPFRDGERQTGYIKPQKQRLLICHIFDINAIDWKEERLEVFSFQLLISNWDYALKINLIVMQRKQGQLRSFDKGNKNASKENKKVECFLKGFKGSKDREKKIK